MAIPFSPPPSGRAALVHVDVEGGGRLLRRIPHEMESALRLYDDVLRRALQRTGGHEVRTWGHSMLAAWRRPADALAWCMRVQQELLELNWSLALLEQPEAEVVRDPVSDEVVLRGLRARMGLHVGVLGARRDDRDGRRGYYGPAVTHAARVASAAHGGQVLASEAAWRELVGDLPADVVTRPLGVFRLHGQRGAWPLVQLLPRSLSERRFAAPRTADVRGTNVPVREGGLVGRDGDLAALDALFGAGVRLVTVVGASGTGRSRLASAYAASRARVRSGGAWVCRLDRARSPELVLRAVASTLEVPLTRARDTEAGVQQIGHALAGRGDVLLMLDAWEGGPGFLGPMLEAWSARAPDARLLLVADAPLGIRGEVVYRLGPLAMPEAGSGGAVALFEAVTRSVRPSFRLATADLDALYEIVRIAGGVPLAIELVASRASVLSLHELLRGLQQRCAGRHYGEVATPERGLANALEWAWDQTSFWERDALAQCAVFRGGFTLEAAQAVIDLTEHPSAPWLGDVLESLVERRLLQAGERPEAPGVRRFVVPKGIARFASRRLSQVAREAAERRHAEHFLSAADTWVSQAGRHGGGEALAWLELELDNLFAVHRRALARRPLQRQLAEKALRIAVLLEPLLGTWGPVQCQLALLDPALAAAPEQDVDSGLRIRALRVRARANGLLGAYAQARADLDDGRFLARAARDRVGEALCLASLGRVHATQGHGELAFEAYTEASVAFVEVGDRRGEGRVCAALGELLLAEGDIDGARSQLEHAIELLREEGDRRGEGRALGALGEVHGRRGDVAHAARMYQDAIALHTRTGDRRQEVRMLAAIAALHDTRGETRAAVLRYRRALTLAREVGARADEAASHLELGLALLEQGDDPGAEEHLLAGLAVCRDVADRRREARALGRIGLLQHLRGRLDAAREAYVQAEQLLANLGDQRERAVVLARHAALEAEGGDIGLAERLFERSSEASTHPEPARLRDVLYAVVDRSRGHEEAARRRVEGAAGSGGIRLATRIVERTQATEAALSHPTPAR